MSSRDIQRCRRSATIGGGSETARERDIATYAARGETAKDIAARLFLSTRTVNNHLQNVYTKLGISGRRELADALGLTDPISEPGP